MVSQYKHRMTLIVPALFMPQANQLALIAGENAADVNTFTETDWQDAEGNLYAVCSAAVKPVVLQAFGKSLADSGLDMVNADTTSAQVALDNAVMYAQGMTATPDKIVIGVDIEPLDLFSDLGLTMIVSDSNNAGFV